MIAYVIVGILLGVLITWLCLQSKIKSTKSYDQKLAQENDALLWKNKDLTEQHKELVEKLFEARTELQITEVKKNETAEHIKDLERYAEEAGTALYESAIEKAAVSIESALTKMSEEYQNAEEACRQEYADVMKACAEELRVTLAANEEELSALRTQLDEMRAKAESAVAANKRAEELKTATEFYKLQLSEVDVQEIEMLRNVAPYLRDKEPLNKVIWKCYYEKPTTDLIGRVVGSNVRTGIYKITNLENGMCYVGQAVNIADRWKQHIKRGIGAEAPTRNKLYPAMITLGPESFSFEIVEDCSREDLDEREDYWQDYFKAKEFGYSIK